MAPAFVFVDPYGFKVPGRLLAELPLLIEPTPNFERFREWVIGLLRARPWRWQELQGAVLDKLWRETHLNRMIQQLRRDKVITASDFLGKFSPSKDPLLSLQADTQD